MHQVSEDADDLALHLVGVAAEVAVVERVAHVVDCVSHEGQQCGVVEVLIAGIANRMPTQRVEFSKKGIESSLSIHSCLPSLNHRMQISYAETSFALLSPTHSKCGGSYGRVEWTRISQIDDDF